MALATAGAAIDYLRKRFGGDFILRRSIAVVPASSQPGRIATHSAERVWLGIFNTSTDDVVVAPFSDLAQETGIRLVSNLGFIAFDIENDAVLPTHEWWGVTTALASRNVVVLEAIRDTVAPTGA